MFVFEVSVCVVVRESVCVTCVCVVRECGVRVRACVRVVRGECVA